MMYPALFTIGWIDFPSYATLMALALGVGLAVAWIEARRIGLPQMDVLDVALFAVLAGVILARAAYVAMHWDYFGTRTNEAWQVWRGGLVWHGGWVGGVIGVAIASMRRKLDMRVAFDVLAPGLMAAAMFGWIGCHLAGIGYGREVFPNDQWWFLVADQPDSDGLWNPRFSTQLLGAAWAAVCFVVAMGTLQGRRQRTSDAERKTESILGRRSFVAHGTGFAITMALYSAGMFALGFTRGDAMPMIGAWRADQVMDAGIVVAGVVYILLTTLLSLVVRQRTSDP